MSGAKSLGDELVHQISSLPDRSTAPVRRIRRSASRRLRGESAEIVLELANYLLAKEVGRWVAYELIANHKGAFETLDRQMLEELGQGIDSWHTVDSFARILSGPAWRDGLIDDNVILAWASSSDRWWRRAALVSTVALNVRSHGGRGDAERTLAICGLLTEDQDDMVVKALSWALRELITHDPAAVRTFLLDHSAELAARVKREVTNKLETGLKNP